MNHNKTNTGKRQNAKCKRQKAKKKLITKKDNQNGRASPSQPNNHCNRVNEQRNSPRRVTRVRKAAVATLGLEQIRDRTLGHPDELRKREVRMLRAVDERDSVEFGETLFALVDCGVAGARLRAGKTGRDFECLRAVRFVPTSHTNYEKDGGKK